MFDRLLKLATIAAAIIAAVLIMHAYQHAKGVADHPCPPGNFPVLAPTGWGCAQTLHIGVKSRP